MKISIVGPAHPYRGGLAVIMQSMARVFQHRGDEVKIKTFTLQYPRIFFPGRNQTVQTPPPPDLYIVRCVNTMNPFNWIAVGRWIAREKPDFVLMKYWTPFMAPCFGTIARFAKKNGTTRILCQIDNVEPHERHMTDKPFNRYFLRAVDGFIYMSEQVHRELRRYTQVPALFSPHPLFENFGIVIDRTEACIRLELDPSKRYALFFGLIRDYKGLDLLLDAWKIYKREHPAEDRRLIVAGEFGHAGELLGRPYSIGGRVVRGRQLGRTLGFPTANLRFPKTPALSGIYATWVHGVFEQPWPSVSSFGTRPTVEGVEPLLEAHLFDFNGDLYGRHIEVEFVAKLRDEEKFNDLPALTEQMHRDAEQARRILNEHRLRATA